MIGRQNAETADILHLQDIAMATTFWLSMGYNFGCMTASNTLFDSSYQMKTVDFEVLRDVGMATIFWLSIYGVHIDATWRLRLNRRVRRRCGLMSNYFDHLLWPPCVADADIIFLSSFFPFSLFFSSPNLSGRRLDVYHTSTHGVALVRI